MIRAVSSALIGYAVMVACVMAGIAAVWYALGNEFAFAGDTTMASTGWSVAILVAGFVAAIAGGTVAALVGGPKGRLAVRVLVSLTVIFGGLTFIAQLDAQALPLPDGKSVRDLEFMEAGRYAVSPMWYNAAIVFVGAIGVWLGGKLCLPQSANQQSASPGGDAANPEGEAE